METSTSRESGRATALVPVQTTDGRWLAPCAPARARQLIRAGKARLSWHGSVPHLLLLGDLSIAPSTAAASPGASA
jgi:hypothetical protein